MTQVSRFRRIIPALCLAMLPLGAAPVVAQQRVIDSIFAIGGALVVNEINQRNRNQNQTAPRTQRVDPAAAQRAAEQREQLRLVQTRLNTLGYDAGVPDGLSGPKTRRAISDFQASIGQSPTGTITDEQIAMLYEQSMGIGGGYIGGGQPAYPATPGFPALATPANAPPIATPSFPALGTPATPSMAPTGNFPALGTAPASPPGPTGNFPALGAAQTPPPGPSGSFPALAVPSQGAPTSAFPTIGTAAAVAQPTAPLVAGSERAALALPVASTLSTEVGLTAYAKLESQPEILGVALGAPAADFVAMLTENGFAGCAGQPSAQQCTRQTATLTDTIKGWTGADGQLWAIARLIQFSEPVPTDFIHGQFTQSYPELMAAPGGLIASGENCAINGQGVPALAAVFDKNAGAETASEVPAALLELAVQCPVAYSLAFNEGNGQIAAVQVLFFDGTSIVRQHVASHEARQTQIGADLKF